VSVNALKELAGRVESGNFYGFNEFATCWENALGIYTPNTAGYTCGYNAYKGSLDAAKALHEAVLPEWGWVWSNRGKGHVTPNSGKYSRLAQTAENDDPARAWLLAILKALIAQEMGQ
tara:strand:- start:2797 stop:3150 length:354 start_codon:yes stop_codon:yes gene_type:complete